MHLLALIYLAVAATMAQEPTPIETGQLGDAAQNFDNPEGAAYRAVVGENTHGTTGMITAITSDDGATEFAVEFSNLPNEGGPFSYHIHVLPVAADGNCNSTLAHLDPYNRGELTPCATGSPQTCQVGDLGGKHGKANTTSFTSSYVDTFVSLKEGSGSFFGNRSFVVHFANKTRIGCGNFSSLSEDVRMSPSVPLNSSSSAQSNFATLLPNVTVTETVASATSSVLADSAMTFSTPFAEAAATSSIDAPSAAATNTPLEVADNAGSSVSTNLSWILLAGVVSILSFS